MIKFKRMQASVLSVVLFLLSLWGLGEALKNNIMYAIPISLGTFLGTFTQLTLEKRKSERERDESRGTSCEEDSPQL
jgi:hypothetical protein